MNDKELLKISLDNLADAIAAAFEISSKEGKAFAFLLDALIKYGTVLYYELDFHDAAVDFNKLDDKLYKENLAKSKREAFKIIKGESDNE